MPIFLLEKFKFNLWEIMVMEIQTCCLKASRAMEKLKYVTVKQMLLSFQKHYQVMSVPKKAKISSIIKLREKLIEFKCTPRHLIPI